MERLNFMLKFFWKLFIYIQLIDDNKALFR